LSSQLPSAAGGRARGRGWLLLGVLAAACSSESVNNTLIVVEVQSDLAVPQQLDGVRIEARTGRGGTASRSFVVSSAGALPVRLAIVPEGSTGGSLSVTVTALAGATATLTQLVETAFVPNQARKLVVFLGRDCVPLAPTCGTGKTCRMSACVGPADGVTLVPYASDAGAPGGGDDGGGLPDAPAPITDGATTPAPDGAPPPPDTEVPPPDGPPAACGAVGIACCPTGRPCLGAATCSGTTCACAAPAMMCNNVCVNLATSPNNCGACGHDCQGGTCTMGTCQPVMVAMQQENPAYITVDDAFLYWRRGPSTSGSIGRMRKDGMAMGAGDLIGGLNGIGAIVSDNTRVYYYANGQVASCAVPACAGGPQALAPTRPTMTLGVDIIDLAFNPARSRVFWTDQAHILSVPIGGGMLQTHLTGTFPSTSVAVDLRFIYYVDRNPMNVVSLRKRTAVDPPALGILVEFPAAAALPRQLAVTPNRLLWVSNGAVSALPLPEPAGTAVPPPLAGGSPIRIAIEGNQVFWTDFVSPSMGRVLSCPTVGCRPSPVVVATFSCGPGFIAADAQTVYWTCPTAGLVMKVAR
jgi:hypothetical protein